MKKAFLSLVLGVLGMNLFAPVLLQQDFSAGQMPPSGWMVFGNTANWVISQTNNAGGVIPEGKVTATNTSAVNTAFNTSISTITYLDIQSQHEVQGNNVTISADLLPYANYSNVTVHIAVLERITTGNIASNGETEFHNVMMKMVPDAYGTAVSLNANQPLNLSYTVDMSSTNVEEMDDLIVAIFVQDNSTKEIYQSNYSVETGSMFTMTPANGATNVSIAAPLTIQYHQAIRMIGGTAITNNNVASLLTLKQNGPLGTDVPFTATINSAKTLITVTPNSNLISLTPYYLRVAPAENNSGIPTLEGISNFTAEFSTVGLQERKAGNFSFYPNPASDKLVVEGNGRFEIKAVELLSATGKSVRIMNGNFAADETVTIDVADLAAGIYYLRITGKQSHETLKVVINR
ncbi:MAG: T9SS type A sorting domain-containing protein [Bacteroidales bacterium]|nr:T9SS type A sorting domain-containing protein [Bacteroidales bacterium]